MIDNPHLDFWLNLLSLWIYTVFFRYKGSYCSQEVAIKVLKPENLNMDMVKEFSQEVFIMRCVSCTIMVENPFQHNLTVVRIYFVESFPYLKDYLKDCFY